jgi:hypothetical protein
MNANLSPDLLSSQASHSFIDLGRSKDYTSMSSEQSSHEENKSVFSLRSEPNIFGFSAMSDSFSMMSIGSVEREEFRDIFITSLNMDEGEVIPYFEIAYNAKIRSIKDMIYEGKYEERVEFIFKDMDDERRESITNYFGFIWKKELPSKLSDFIDLIKVQCSVIIEEVIYFANYLYLKGLRTVDDVLASEDVRVLVRENKSPSLSAGAENKLVEFLSLWIILLDGFFSSDTHVIVGKLLERFGSVDRLENQLRTNEKRSIGIIQGLIEDTDDVDEILYIIKQRIDDRQEAKDDS